MQKEVKGQKNEASAETDHVKSLAIWLERRGHPPGTIHNYTRLARKFVRWVAATERSIGKLCATDLDCYAAYLESSGHWRHRGRRGCNYYTSARHLVTCLQDGGEATKCCGTQSPGDRLLVRFQQWTRSHRGLMDATIRNYSGVVRELIDALGSDPADYSARDLRAFVLDRARRHGPASAERVVTAVRVFLRYLVAIGDCPAGFEHAIPSVAKWRLARLPAYLPAEDIERVVRSTDPGTAVGARDHAVLLLLARLGLRASDIALMKLDDLYWKQSRLRVCGKGRREAWLPLPQDVGDAILHYLDAGRPATASARLFLLSRPPFAPMEPHVVCQIARRGLRRAQVETPTRGVRVFRHSLATTMLRSGVPLQTIASVLRHHCIDTTLHYTKVDVEMLKRVAAPWPGGTSC